MKKYLITHNATVGRQQADGAHFPPVELLFYSMVEAESVEQAGEKVIRYSDPSFVTQVKDVTEVGEGLSADELYALLEHKKIMVEATI